MQAPARAFALAPGLLGMDVSHQCQAVLDLFPGPARESSWWSQSRDLATLLVKFRYSEATDERDKVYALLNLCSEAHNSKMLSADYGKPIARVIEDTVFFLISFLKGRKSGCNLSQPSFRLSRTKFHSSWNGSEFYRSWSMKNLFEFVATIDKEPLESRWNTYREDIWENRSTLLFTHRTREVASHQIGVWLLRRSDPLLELLGSRSLEDEGRCRPRHRPPAAY